MFVSNLVEGEEGYRRKPGLGAFDPVRSSLC